MNKHARTAARGSVQERIKPRTLDVAGSMVQVPTFDVKPTELIIDEQVKRGAVVKCRRCKETFIVLLSRWRRSSGYVTRPCPYCFKVSKIPSSKKRRSS